MFNIWKIIAFVVTLLLTTISLASTCVPGDATCELNQKKLQAMDQEGIKPIETKDEQLPSNSETDKKKSEPTPFQIPKAGSHQVSVDQDVPHNPVLKIPTPVEEKPLEQKQTATTWSQSQPQPQAQAQPQAQQSQASIWR